MNKNKRVSPLRSNYAMFMQKMCLSLLLGTASLFAVGDKPLLSVNQDNEKALFYVGNTQPSNGQMQMQLLLLEGLQPKSYVLEVDCGALVAGIPIMSFLEKGHFVGIDPNRWLIEDSLKIETNRTIVESRRPLFLFNDQFDASETKIRFDYILSHSILSHAAHWQLPLFLENCAKVLKKGGKVVVSIRLTEPNEFGSAGAPHETMSNEWIYPGNSFFDKATVIEEGLKWFSHVEQKKEYTKLITSTDKSAFHDWFVFIK